jgi:hypothetical protein
MHADKSATSFSNPARQPGLVLSWVLSISKRINNKNHAVIVYCYEWLMEQAEIQQGIANNISRLLRPNQTVI